MELHLWETDDRDIHNTPRPKDKGIRSNGGRVPPDTDHGGRKDKAVRGQRPNCSSATQRTAPHRLPTGSLLCIVFACWSVRVFCARRCEHKMYNGYSCNSLPLVFSILRGADAGELNKLKIKSNRFACLKITFFTLFLCVCLFSLVLSRIVWFAKTYHFHLLFGLIRYVFGGVCTYCLW